MSLIITDLPQIPVRVFNDGRTFIRAHRRDFLTHIGDLPCVPDHYLFRLVGAEILEFLQHFLRRAQVKGRLFITVLKSLSRHNNPAVHLILRVQKMNVAGSTDRFSELVSQFHDLLVNVDQILLRIHSALFIPEHKAVVAQRLNFQVVIEPDQSGDLRIGPAPKQCLIQFPRLTGRSHD